ncbi:MAG: patatin-like phospholipase family protein [Pseudobdellovibrio sp.]
MKHSAFFDKPFTLALSSGFFGFYAHLGFLKALEELRIKPTAYTGTSAGAIVAAAAARGMSIKEIENLIRGVSRKDFWDPALGFGLLRGRKLRELIAREIGADFKELKAPLRIPVFDIMERTTKVFTSGNLARVIQATCAVPLMFQPVRIGRRFYWDGGIQDKMGIHGLNKNEKILCHFLKSRGQDPHGIYERKQNANELLDRGENLVQVQLEGIPTAHPFAMDRGAEIIEAAYKKTLLALNSRD